MSEHYGTRVIPKRDAPEMHATAHALHVLGVLPRERFLDDYTTVWGTRIYACFTPGAHPDARARWRRMITCVHEHQHVEQARRLGFARFATRYVLSPVRRAIFEAEATRCELELLHWRGEELPEPEALVARLGDYGVDTRARDAALEYYARAIPDVIAGGAPAEATQIALGILSRGDAPP